MSQAAVFDTPALKWPFAARPSGAPRRAMPVAPALPSAPATHPPAAGPAPAQAPQAQIISRPAPGSTAILAVPNASAKFPAARAPVANEVPSLGGRATLTATLTWRQKLGDVLLVAMWGAIIPGVLWFGHAAGF
ncbi:MAG: hypothetical protein JHC61_09605 [Burkholderiaceae bacterium]|nr:hypothetical protein [Burkholderiaceae bacterium]